MASSVVSDNFETSTGAIPNMGGADITTRLCSAWVNFDGTGTVAIRAAYNVSSITDNGAGDYTVNFTTAMPDGNYAVTAHSFRVNGVNAYFIGRNNLTATAVGSCRIWSGTSIGAFTDIAEISVSIFR